MSKLGYILGIVGSGIMLGSNVILLLITLVLGMIGGLFGEGLGEIGLEFTPITQLITIGLAIVGIVYSVKAKGGAKIGYMVLMIVGLITAIGVFIPIVPPRILDMGDGSTYPAPAITLISSLIYIDPYFLINGGLLGLLTAEFVSTEEREVLKVEKEAIKKERMAIRKERDKVTREKKAAKKKKKGKVVKEVEKQEIEEIEVIKREREALKREREALQKEREELEKEKEEDTTE